LEVDVKKINIAAAITVLLMAGVSAAEDNSMYIRAAHSFRDVSYRSNVGMSLATVTPGVYLRMTGEVGGILARRTGLDYLYSGALGWMFGEKAAGLAIYGIGGYRQWSLNTDPGSAPETPYFGAGVKTSQKGAYIAGEAYRYSRGNVWRPYIEIGNGNSRQSIGVYYEKSPDGGNVAGLKYGFVLR
jgi:hypothetical protein